MDVQSIARALGGVVSGGQVMAPAPGHSARDRSLSIRLDPSAPDGLLVNTFAGDEPLAAKNYVMQRLGLERVPRPARGAGRPARPRPAPARPAPQLGRAPIPEMTPLAPGDRRGLQAIGEPEPPPVTGEVPGRRHIYRRDGQAVRVKIRKTRGAAFIDFYLVKDSEQRITGWQAKRPASYVPVPYVGSLDPFDGELAHDAVFWPEGEKDVDTLARLGLPAFTYGGAQDVPEGCGALLAGRDVVILIDNDGPGRECAERKVAACAEAAARVRVVGFPELDEGQDVSDWIEAGGTVEGLWQRVEAAEAEAEPGPPIRATPFRWIDPAAIPPRGWIYGWHYIRKFIATTIAPGGIGKSSLVIVEALAIATGQALLGITPNESTPVWIWNGEDPREEMERRVMAAALRYRLRPEDLEGRLFLDSGRTAPIVIARQTREGTVIAEPVVEAVKAAIRDNGIGVFVVDPFVSSHEVSENDNGAINAVATVWAQIADETGCAIELVHHARKGQGGEVTVEDGRGASALLSKARAGRALNVMTEEEAERAGVENRRLHFRYYDGKANLAPPADSSTWLRLASVDLGNARADRPADSVGVAESWWWPDPFTGVTTADLRAVQQKVSEGRYRESSQAKDWVGRAVAEALRLDVENKADRAKIKGLLKTRIRTGALRIVDDQDERGNKRPFVEVGEWAT